MAMIGERHGAAMCRTTSFPGRVCVKKSCIGITRHMGREYVSREKKLPMVNFLIFVQKNVSTIRFQEIKIRPFQDFEKKAFFSLFLMRKRLSSGQKWFLRPYFPLIRGMFLLRSGLRFSFRALEVPEPRVRKRPLSLTNRAFSSLSKRKSKTTFQ